MLTDLPEFQDRCFFKKLAINVKASSAIFAFSSLSQLHLEPAINFGSGPDGENWLLRGMTNPSMIVMFGYSENQSLIP